MDIRKFFAKADGKKKEKKKKPAGSSNAARKVQKEEQPSTPSTVASEEEHELLKENQESFKNKSPAKKVVQSKKATAPSNDANAAAPKLKSTAKYPVGTQVEKETADPKAKGKSSSRANKKQRTSYQDEEEEYEEEEDSEEDSEEEDIMVSRRRKTPVKPSSRRAILEDSSDEEMEAVDHNEAPKKPKATAEKAAPPAAKNPKTTAEPPPAKKPKTNSAAASRTQSNAAAPAKSAWGSLRMDTGKSSSSSSSKKKKSTGGGKKATADTTTSDGSKRHVRAATTKGDDLPVITEPALMFDDMISNQLTDNGRDASVLLPLLKTLHGRSLRVATMCSGTESPLLALDMLSKSIDDFYHANREEFEGIDVKDGESVLQISHVFSCEIEPFKQAYIERNFGPEILFRDLRELGNEEAFTAYGSRVPVPNEPGCVDLCVAGTSCVDYSNLNNKKKKITEGGESGQTWNGLIDWITKAAPPIVILENVYGAPWKIKVEIFENLGYHATFVKVDSKNYYIPQTRQRGYLLAVKKENTRSGLLKNWKDMMKKLERPASGALEAFMLPNDDPRVSRGRARLAVTSASSQGTNYDWVKCQSRHLFARASEELGEKHPLTGSDSGNAVMPPFAWNEWANAQVPRVHDLLDISTLRCAKEGVDCTTKCMIWELSQNVDRDTMGKLGLSQCLTPSGIPYLTNRGAPLVGEELLKLQGIPADDLLLTKESDKDLKDMAGNAMTTTVVGACMLSALVLGHAAIGTNSSRKAQLTNELARSLVPRPLALATSGSSVTREMAKYSRQILPLGPLQQSSGTYQQLLQEAVSSARMCITEGMDAALPLSSLLQCKLCGFTCSRQCAEPLPSKFEEHELIGFDRPEESRVDPSSFRSNLLSALPMRLELCSFGADSIQKPAGVSDEVWDGWKSAVVASTTSSSSSSSSEEYRFSELIRTHVWTAMFLASNGSRLALELSKAGAVWFLFATPPTKKGSVRDVLEKPIARMLVQPDGDSFTNGQWEVCLPTASTVELTIEGAGQQLPSFQSRLGLKGQYEKEVRFEKLKISIQADDCDELKSRIEGEYSLLPKCGGACGSLHKREQAGSDGSDAEFFFLDSGRYTLAEDDTFVFSKDKHRTSRTEVRDITLQVDVKANYRPEFQSENVRDNQSKSLRAIIPGSWIEIDGASLNPVSDSIEEKKATIVVPVESPQVSLVPDGWRSCPAILEAQIALSKNDWLYSECQRLLSRSIKAPVLEVNIQKSATIFKPLAFATSRLSVPDVAQSWLSLDSNAIEMKDGDEVACEVCAPTRPGVKWTMVVNGKQRQMLPIGDGKQYARFEHLMKHRPDPWLVTLQNQERDEIQTPSMGLVDIKIAVNAVSLVNRALGLFPPTLARRAMIDHANNQSISKEARTIFEWRVVSHADRSSSPESGSFPKLQFTSNKKDQPASQPPCFESRHPLRPEQLRSLAWMLSQEATTTPYFEEEVVEAVLPSMGWRAEGRARRPVLVRGGIVADEVGFGKTALSLGLIDAAPKVNGEPPSMPSEFRQSFFQTKATLVIVPTHLLSQWPKECSKFCGSTKNIVVISTMTSFNKLTVAAVLNADIVIVSFSVLSGNNAYFARLARFAGVDCSSVPKGTKGGRHFDAVYKECLRGAADRIAAHRDDCSAAFDEIQRDSQHHESSSEEQDGHLRLDGKKKVYKNVSAEQAKSGGNAKSKSSTKTKTKTSSTDVDPWKLRTDKVKKDMKQMSCPPLECFFWNRLVVDEFTYIHGSKDRARVQSLVAGLKSTYRWGLSATPPHETFNDMQTLAGLLGINLGVDEVLPTVLSKKSSKEDDTPASEKFSSLLEVRSIQWHENRHHVGQEFLDRFVRQNIAEIDEIKCEEHTILMDLPAAERGIYLEMENYLKSLEMDNKKALKSKKKSKGDRENRMQRILEDSETAEEALLKRSSHFNMSATHSTALETCDVIISHRKEELADCEKELIDSIAAALRQRNLIVTHDSGWKGMARSEKGEVEDSLERYLSDVNKKNSIQGGADDEIHLRLQQIVEKAEEDVKKNPLKEDEAFAVANSDVVEDEEEEGECKSKGKKRSKHVDEVKLYAMKFALRNHMHKVRNVGKELRGRIQSLRYFNWVRLFQLEDTEHVCVGHESSFCDCQTSGGKVPRDRLGVLSSCGHAGCLSCLQQHADREDCIDPTCQVPVKRTHIASATGLGVDRKQEMGGQYGAKLTAIVKQVKQLVDKGDRVIVFVQFDDLKQKVAEALLASKVKSLQVKGSVQKQIKALDVLQKEIPAKDDPRVLLLTMDDESSAGVNLTTCNHAIFVHPLLADSQQQYDAYETQAVGRIRRYGQQKTVHIWRYLARDTIDTEIYEDRRGALPSS